MVGRGHTKPWGPSMEATASITFGSFSHARRVISIAMLAVALTLNPVHSAIALASDPPAESRTLYRLNAVLDLSGASLDVTESVQLTNLTGRDLDSIVLHLPP